MGRTSVNEGICAYLCCLFDFDNLVGAPNAVDDLVLSVIDQLALPIFLIFLPKTLVLYIRL